MKIKNGLGQAKLTPDAERRKKARELTKELKKTPPKSIKALEERIAAIEDYLGL